MTTTFNLPMSSLPSNAPFGKYIRGEVCVAKSTIPKAGNGLFAMRKFKKGQRVCGYGGFLYPKSLINSMPSRYAVDVGNPDAVLIGDTAWEDGGQLGPYAQDGSLPADQKALGISVNVELCAGWETVCLVATRQIAQVCCAQSLLQGEEIFLNYGKEYQDYYGLTGKPDYTVDKVEQKKPRGRPPKKIETRGRKDTKRKRDMEQDTVDVNSRRLIMRDVIENARRNYSRWDDLIDLVQRCEYDRALWVEREEMRDLQCEPLELKNN
jgi:hypothetical protein